MRHVHLEIYTERTNRQLLNDLKADGGHAIVLSFNDVPDVPEYVAQPYPDEAYMETPPEEPPQTIRPF